MVKFDENDSNSSILPIIGLVCGSLRMYCVHSVHRHNHKSKSIWKERRTHGIKTFNVPRTTYVFPLKAKTKARNVKRKCYLRLAWTIVREPVPVYVCGINTGESHHPIATVAKKKVNDSQYRARGSSQAATCDSNRDAAIDEAKNDRKSKSLMRHEHNGHKCVCIKTYILRQVMVPTPKYYVNSFRCVALHSLRVRLARHARVRCSRMCLCVCTRVFDGDVCERATAVTGKKLIIRWYACRKPNITKC